MRIVFDPPKRIANLKKHGLDLSSITEDFFEAAAIYEARDGRYLALGPIGELIAAVVFKPMGKEAISVISLRPASRKERHLL